MMIPYGILAQFAQKNQNFQKIGLACFFESIFIILNKKQNFFQIFTLFMTYRVKWKRIGRIGKCQCKHRLITQAAFQR